MFFELDDFQNTNILIENIFTMIFNTLKKTIFILTFILTSSILSGQTFVGTSSDKMKSYGCTFRLNKDSTINFIYERNENSIYAEHIGKIKKINDTLFRAFVIMTVGQFYMKSPSDDTLTIKVDTLMVSKIDKFTIHFSNGQTKELKKCYDKWFKYHAFHLPINEKWFNSQKGTDYVFITTGLKGLISGEELKFKIPFGSAASFLCGQKDKFEIIIKDGLLWTTGKASVQIGQFKLKQID
ncbi:MAG: hypothetical protein LBQ60_16065 [Bacteroidales bacterium]|jgi:hypothetical protein|nr:hypothetical protein [Bacteroidales bacterium]